jgi:hypothetical protein
VVAKVAETDDGFSNHRERGYPQCNAGRVKSTIAMSDRVIHTSRSPAFAVAATGTQGSLAKAQAERT